MNAIVRRPCGSGRAVGDSVEASAGYLGGNGDGERRLGGAAGCAARAHGPPAGQRRAPGRRPRVRGALLALPAPDRGVRLRHGQGLRPRRGHHAGGLRLRAAAHAQDRAADRLQAVDLRDRQERLHRRLPARRGAPRRSPTTPTTGSRRPTTCGSSPPARSPTPPSTPSWSSTTSAARSAGCRESHHEILVLRELEGLSYKDIGERMGMSRPAVESTLFRARKRLGEEYDELASGRALPAHPGHHRRAAAHVWACATASKLARHLSHCQPCRRLAAGAGLEVPVPARRRVAEKIAGLLPLPAFLRVRRGGDEAASAFGGGGGGWMAHAPSFADAMSSGWSKGAAGLAALLLAGAGVSTIAELGQARRARHGLPRGRRAARRRRRRRRARRGARRRRGRRALRARPAGARERAAAARADAAAARPPGARRRQERGRGQRGPGGGGRPQAPARGGGAGDGGAARRSRRRRRLRRRGAAGSGDRRRRRGPAARASRRRPSASPARCPT